MNFLIIDLSLLLIFIAFISIFLYKNKKNVGKEGSLILYRTKLGMKLIDKIGGKYSKTLKFLSYVSITLGYILMILMLIMIFQSVWLYFTTSISEQIKAPPVAPLIPYFPELFGLESYFPSFYFIYFIIALIIVATVHEFAHGIFARKYEVPIKSTGFAFWKYFPAVLGAFVEQDDKFMTKKSSFEQKAILSAGVFANTITAIVFFVILTLFFSLTFAPVGIQYNAYAYNYINISSINQINNVSVENANYSMLIANLQTNEENFNEIKIGNYSFIAKNELIKSQSENSGILFLYYDGVAIRNNLYENIVSINGEKVVSLENLSQTLKQFSPGEKINITTIKDFYNKKIDEKTSEVILTPRPNNKSESWIGIAIVETSPTKVGKILSILPQYSEKNVYYAAPEIAIFIKNLIWWVMMINILVALFNMLPLGILDGGRFFYLTIQDITGKEEIAKKAFVGITYLIMFLLLLMMIKWAFGFF